LQRQVDLNPGLIALLKTLIVGDFGLATSSLVAVDTSNAPPHALLHTGDMTLGTPKLIPINISLGSTQALFQRWEQDYTLLLKSYQENGHYGIIARQICTV
jgi:hypothetical protein